ncbi:carbohydrate kinase family protein [Vallicoccus soli]|uniref:carbohydrate kinase family protein n=1 Tax=Vallicoccus soli TaxID=2339232 RepID=UPI003CCC8CA4
MPSARGAAPAHAVDPLRAVRERDAAAGRPEPQHDVFLAGTVFLDIVFTGLEHMPAAGTEVWAPGMGSSPGGVANLAIACSRLGLRTSLAAAFGDDYYAEFCYRTLQEQEGVDLSRSRRFGRWHTPVTVSMAVERDRSMVTHEHEPPLCAGHMIGDPPTSRAGFVDLGAPDPCGSAPDWVPQAAARGTLLFADVGWDPTGAWSPAVLDHLAGCHAFMPNAVEAMSYTRTGTPRAAVEALAGRTPLVVVTDGARGALAVDATTGERAQVPALQVDALDPTGAGDVFGAGVVLGTLAGWPLADRLAFAALCSGLAVQQFGGSLAAPGWGDIADWWHAVRDGDDRALRERYAFLDRVVPPGPVRAVRRAEATIAQRADLAEPDDLSEPDPSRPDLGGAP